MTAAPVSIEPEVTVKAWAFGRRLFEPRLRVPTNPIDVGRDFERVPDLVAQGEIG
jgi:hypothetical protein